MIKDWQIKNFKSLNNSKKINIKPITFLVGPNSSGKTSFLQSILMLRQTVESKDLKSALILQDYIDLGSFKDVVWKHDLNDIISINFSDSNSNYVEGVINLLNEVFEVGTEFIGEYVWATICLKKQKLEVYYRAQDQDVAMLIKNFSYEISEEIKTRQDVWKN